MSVILTKSFAPPPFDGREALRYAGCREADEATLALLDAARDEAWDALSYRVCYGIFPVSLDGDACDLDGFSVRSASLAKHLSGCREAVIFAATVGVGLDRLIARYGATSPARALMMQAIGAERIEALCDEFCEALATETGRELRPRFSAGYGDLPLETQREIFRVLDCERKIGLVLNNSLLMSPTKSVTAIVGLCDQ